MPVRPIILEELNALQRDKILRGKAKRVGRIDDFVRRLIDDMIETMREAPGVGLAAPQIGVSLRVIVVEYEDELYTVVNPEIVKSSGESTDDEGCLSAPNWLGPVSRATSLIVKGRDRAGKEVRIKADDWLARIFQHEVDHLDGVLFLDKVHDKSKIHWADPDEADEDGDEGEASTPRRRRRSGAQRSKPASPVTSGAER